MDKNFPGRLESTKDIVDIFEVVKDATRESIGNSRGGLMLGLADLGNHPKGFFGAFFTVGTNIIVMNKIPLQRIEETQPELCKPYTFIILLHEYLHSLGYIDERVVRRMVYKISKEHFGRDHLTTRIAANISRFVPSLAYPDIAWSPPGNLKIDLVDGFDRSSATSYIG